MILELLLGILVRVLCCKGRSPLQVVRAEGFIRAVLQTELCPPNSYIEVLDPRVYLQSFGGKDEVKMLKPYSRGAVALQEEEATSATSATSAV